MAGMLGKALGWDTNPIYQGFDSKRNAIGNAFAGLAGATSFGDAMKGVSRGALAGNQFDLAEAIRQEQLAKQKEQMAASVASLRRYGKDAWADAVESGAVDPQAAMTSMLQGMDAPAPDPTSSVGGRQQLAQQYGLTGDQATQFILTGKLPSTQVAQADLPSDVREYEYAKGQGYDGSYVDYQREMKVKPSGPMDATTKKELFEAQDAVTSGNYALSTIDRAIDLSKKADWGPWASERAQFGAIIPDIGIGNGNDRDFATIEYKNVVTQLALEQLKAVFGAMPTEGERKILLEVQGSVDQPPEVRESILTRAKEMAQRRIADNQAKADSLRNGSYFTDGYSPGTPAGNSTSTGVTWSIEQ